MKRLLFSITLMMFFFLADAQKSGIYTIECFKDSTIVTKGWKKGVNTYECLNGIKLTYPDKRTKFFAAPVTPKVIGGVAYLYGSNNEAEAFNLISSPYSINGFLDIVKSCNKPNIIDVIGCETDCDPTNENVTGISSVYNETTNLYEFVVTNSDGSTVTSTAPVISETVTYDPDGTDGFPTINVNEGDTYLTDSAAYIFDGTDWIEDPDCCPVVNNTPIAFVPTATGNTTNLNEFVVDSNGDKWYIDNDGNGVLVETESIDYTFTEIYNDEYKDSTVVFENGVPIDTLVSCFGETICTRNYVNIPSTDIEAASDTTLEIISTIDVCGNLKKDTIKTWFESFCVDDNTCRVGFTEFRAAAEQPQCYFVGEGETLNFNADAVIYDGDGCNGTVDTNGDSLEVIGGVISNVINAQQFGNVIVPSFDDWSFEVTGAPFQLVRNNSGINMDFFVSLDEMQIEVDTVCQPLCNPAQTTVLATNADPLTGEGTLTFTAVKLGSPVDDGECIELFVKDSGGTVIQSFTGIIGDDISTFTNYNSTWFGIGGVVENNATIPFDKQQFAFDNGYFGVNADALVFRIEVGGACAGNPNPKCPNKSIINEESSMCLLQHYTYDNAVTRANTINNNGTTTTYNPYAIGGYTFIDNCAKEEFNQGATCGEIDRINSGNWRVESICVDGEVKNTVNNGFYAISGGAIGSWDAMLQAEPILAPFSPIIYDAINIPLYDIGINGVDRCFNYGGFTACEGNLIECFTLINDQGCRAGINLVEQVSFNY